MIVIVNIATKDTFSCLKERKRKKEKKRVYRNDRKILP